MFPSVSQIPSAGKLTCLFSLSACFFICCLLLLTYPLQAQKKVDSVLATLDRQPDSVKIKYLNDLCWKNRADNPVLGIECGEKALELCKKSGNKTLAARSYNLLGIVCRVLGYYDKSLAYLHNALSTAEETNNTIEIGFAENNISGSYRMKGYYTAAMQHVLRGMQIFESIDYKYGIAYCMISIGFIYADQHDYQKALTYFDDAYRMRQAIGDTAGAAIALNEIAITYGRCNNFKTALEKFGEAEQIFKSINNRGGLMSAANGLGDLYIKQSRYAEALPIYRKYYDLACELKIVRSRVLGANRLGIVYTHLHQFAEAEKYLSEARNLTEPMQEYALLLENYSAYSVLYESEGKFEKSLKYARLYSSLKDSILSRENISGVKEMEAVYENEKAKAENALLLKDVELSHSQRNYWVVITILFIGISILFSWKYIDKKRTEVKMRVINSELQALNATRDKFFSIIAHDLRSPFHMMLGISELLSTDIDTLPPEQVKKFSRELHLGIKKQFELLNDLLEWSRLQRGDLPIEKRILSVAAEMQDIIESLVVSVRVKEISLQTDVAGDLKVLADSNMLRLVLRNLVSNSVKFTKPKGNIRISGEKIDSLVRITVSDDGVGIPDADLNNLFRSDIRVSTTGTANEKGTGLGLLLCKEIIERHGGTIQVDSIVGKGSSFSFTVPVGE